MRHIQNVFLRNFRRSEDWSSALQSAWAKKVLYLFHPPKKNSNSSNGDLTAQQLESCEENKLKNVLQKQILAIEIEYF